jgi:type II secretory pathway component PulK
MTSALKAPHRKNGFALIVVLGTLTVLTVLFAMSSSRIMNTERIAAAEARVAMANQRDRDLLLLAADARRNSPDMDQITLSRGDEEITLRFQDVGGLIDLNGARPELVEHLVARFVPETGDVVEATAAVHRFRAEGGRFLRIEQLFTVMNAPTGDTRALARVATVYSGSAGISVEMAPVDVLEIVTNQQGARELLAELVEEADRGRANGQVFQIREEVAGAPEAVFGSMLLRPGGTSVMVLHL